MEINFKTQAVALVGFKLGPLDVLALAVIHLHPFENSNKLLGHFLQFNASTLQQKHKRRCRAIQNGYFFGGDVDDQIVDAQTGTSRHQVLYGMHFGLPTGNGGSQAGVGDALS